MGTAAEPLDAATLAGHAVPAPAADGDKETRGHVLVIAGCREMPGAALLAATAALRAGAGKLTVATAASVAVPLALALPEARVIGLAETPAGAVCELDAAGEAALGALAGRVDAVLVGPGMQDEELCCGLAQRVLEIFAGIPLILDAAAMGTVHLAGRRDPPLLLTPHAGEMAHLLGVGKESVEADRIACAVDAARRWHAVVALKGPETALAAPDGRVWLHAAGNIGLATSGSGDVLAGIACGLAARGMPPLDAAMWSVVLHAQAGTRLGMRHGALGYLARDISAEIPALLHELDAGAIPP